ncbi:MAG: hypothetical protein ABSD29_26040 [Verrucomicrobiota bacterium]|jgi:hypothetical protein
MINATPTQLRKAANIQEKIQSLQSELNSILGSPDETAAIEAPGKRREVSAAGRARMRAAQIARWARIKRTAPKKKGKMSAQGLANIRAAQKARWARVKAAKPAQKLKRKISAAGRARLAALARARWAEAKKAGKSRL